MSLLLGFFGLPIYFSKAFSCHRVSLRLAVILFRIDNQLCFLRFIWFGGILVVLMLFSRLMPKLGASIIKK